MQAISLKSLLPIILPLTVVAFLRGLMQGAVQFLAIYIQTVKSVNIAYVGIAFGIMPAMGAFSQPMFGYFSDRFGRRLAIAISAVGMALSFVLFLGISNIIVSEVFLALFGLFNYTSFPLLMGVATEISPKGSTTIGSSIVWGVGTIGGGAIGPLLVAFFALPGVLGSLTWAFFALTIISLTSIVFLPFIYRRQAVRANTREEIAVP